MTMTGGDIASIITALGFLITAIVGLLNFIKTMRLASTVEDIKVQTDGINDKLIAKTDEAARAQGTLVGIDKAKHDERQAAAAPAESTDRAAAVAALGGAATTKVETASTEPDVVKVEIVKVPTATKT